MRYLFTLILVFVCFETIFADKLPEKIQGAANGLMLFSRGESENFSVLDFQKSQSMWGHMCSCHVGVWCSTTSGKTSFSFLKGDESTFTLRFSRKEEYSSDIQIDKSFYSLDKYHDGDSICLVIKILKKVQLYKSNNKSEIMNLYPGSVIVYFFNKDYDENFKKN